MVSVGAVSLGVSLVALAVVCVDSRGPLITCTAGVFNAGTPASVTCNFRTNITAARRSFNMARYPLEFPQGAIGTDILLCPWSKKHHQHQCYVDADDYTFDNVFTDHVTIRMPAVSWDQAGLYMCFFLPSDGIDLHSCELNVVQGSKENATAATEESRGESSFPLLPVILSCVLVALVAISVGSVLFLRRRSAQRTQRNKEAQEMTEKLIPGTEKRVSTTLEGFRLSNTKLVELMHLFDQEIDNSTMASTLPDSNENGEAFVLDLGSLNLKTSLVQVKGHDGRVVQFKSYTIPDDIKPCSLTKILLDFVANCTWDFIKYHKMAGEMLPVVLVVTHANKHTTQDTCLVPPAIQSKCDTYLSKNEKNIADERAIQPHGGTDCRKGPQCLLREALERRADKNWAIRRDIDILRKLEVVAVVNEVVSCLVSVAVKTSACRIGLTVGSGLNAWCVEDSTRLKTECPQDERPHAMIVNTELSNLRENDCVQFCTPFDREVDHTGGTGSQTLNKILSEKYCGEITRLVLERLTKEGALFQSVPLGCALFQRASVTPECVFDIDSDKEEPHHQTRHTLDRLGVQHYTDSDVNTVRRVCSVVVERAAFLSAAGLAALINHVKQPEVTVVVDGYLYNSHPRFHQLMYSKTQELVNQGLKFHLASSRGACHMGAARLALSSLR